MNDKIKELYIKALEESENMRWNIEDSEKFAELIVRECLDACNENNKQVHAHLGVSACVKSIKQRFGITE